MTEKCLRQKQNSGGCGLHLIFYLCIQVMPFGPGTAGRPGLTLLRGGSAVLPAWLLPQVMNTLLHEQWAFCRRVLLFKKQCNFILKIYYYIKSN